MKYSNKYLALYSNLKSLCNKQRMIEAYNFIKIKISLSSNKQSTVTKNITIFPISSPKSIKNVSNQI